MPTSNRRRAFLRIVGFDAHIEPPQRVSSDRRARCPHRAEPPLQIRGGGQSACGLVGGDNCNCSTNGSDLLINNAVISTFRREQAPALHPISTGIIDMGILRFALNDKYQSGEGRALPHLFSLLYSLFSWEGQDLPLRCYINALRREGQDPPLR